MTKRHLLPVLMFLAATGCARDPDAGASPGASTSASTSAASAAGSRRVTLGKATAAVGDVMHVTRVKSEDRVTRTTGPNGGLHMTKKSRSTVETREACLAVDGSRCSALRVRYDKDVDQIEEGHVKVDLSGAPTEKPVREESPSKVGVTQGRTYRVALGDGAPTVTGDDASKPSKEELQAVASAFSAKKRADETAFREAIPKEVAVGQSLAPVAAVVDRMFASTMENAKSETTCVVSDVRDVGGRSLLVLEMKGHVTGATKAGDAIDMKLTATVEIWADSQLEKLSNTLVDMNVAKKGMEVQMHLEERVERAALASFDEVASAAK